MSASVSRVALVDMKRFP